MLLFRDFRIFSIKNVQKEEQSNNGELNFKGANKKMKISTKGRYALRMMIEFGLNPDQCTKISQVAQRQGISDKYLEQIVTLLHRAGYVRSIRGAQGGYMLTKKP